MFRKIISSFLIVSILLFSIIVFKSNKLNSYKSILETEPCKRPVTFSIGSVDERFDKSENELKQDSIRAAEIWNDAYGRDIFAYSVDSELEINFVYDRRQTLETEINNQQEKLSLEKEDLNKRINTYKQKSSELDQLRAKISQDIQNLNSSQNISEEDRERVNSEIDEFNRKVEELNILGKSLNITARDFNKEVNELNNSIGNFNEILSVKPEEGLYINENGDERIEIYFVTNLQELVHTLAHELGHARGLSHNQNSKSIMYTNSSNSLSPTKEDLNELETVCAKRTIFQNIREYLEVNRISFR